MSATRQQIDAAIFDLDGTLLDTEGISEKAVAKIVESYGKEFSLDLHKQILGCPASEWTVFLINKLGLPGDELTPQVFAEKWEHNVHELLPTVDVLPGALDVLQRLHDKGVPIALATSSSKKAVGIKRQMHENLFKNFSVIVTGDDPEVARGKPAPDIFLRAAERLFNSEEAASRKNCLVFEDSVQGVQAGKAAGMTVIALPDTRMYDENDRTRLYSEADEVVTSLEQFDETKYGL